MKKNLKVLIVDDEYLIRNLIRMRINWEEQNMTIIGDAANAHEAFPMVDQYKPDIIFTDICMPFMDGIEFSRVVFEKYPHIKIVVVTGHDEFEYARKSIKLGIADFLLKPIKVQDLLDVTQRLKMKIHEEQSRISEYERLKKELEANLPFIKEKFLNELISENLPASTIRERFSYFGLSVNPEIEAVQIAVVELCHSMPDTSEEDQMILEIGGLKKTSEFFQDDPYVIVFSSNQGRIVILSNNRDLDLPENCELLKASLINTYKCYSSFGIGTEYMGMENSRLSYQEACNALDYKAVIGKSNVIYYGDIVTTQYRRYQTDFSKIEKLRFYMNAGAEGNAAEIVESIFDICGVGAGDIMEQSRLAAMDVFFACRYVAAGQQSEYDSLLREEDMQRILAADNLPEMKSGLLEYVKNLSLSIWNKNRTKAGNLVMQIKEYLNEHMGNSELGLSSVAGEFYVSPGHLGRLMKQETGRTFIEYLTEIRIKQAEKLMRETDLKGYQIGREIGICDPHYFSILFKKTTGMSINEFRSNKTTDDC
ncbi:MAG: response regulator [Acetanaerobacterium sp.]